MAKTKHSFNHLILASMIFISILSAGIVGYLWLSYVYKNFQHELKILRRQSYSKQKQKLKEDVQRTLHFIQFEQKQAKQQLKERLREHVNNAYSIAEAIYLQNSSQKSNAEIGKIITKTLNTLRFNKNREYIFAGNLNGSLDQHPLIHTNSGKEEIKKHQELFKKAIQKVISVAKSPLQEGWCEYKMLNLNAANAIQTKLSYVKCFKPLNWYIGTGEYIDEVEKATQQHVLYLLTQLKYSQTNYIFAGQYNGLSLLGPAKGRNMLHLKGPNGLPIVQELISTAQAGGGYVKYTLPNFQGYQAGSKISYVSPIPDWQWYIGAGTMIQDVEQAIKAKREKLFLEIRNDVLTIIAILSGLLVFIVILSKIVSGKIEKTLFHFSKFFQNAADKSAQINLADLPFIEFTNMAISANKMIKARETALTELTEKEANLRITLNSMNEAVISTNTAGLIQRMNPVAEQLTGNTSKEAQNQFISHILKLRKHDKKTPFNIDTGKLQNQDDYSIKVFLEKSDETVCPVLFSSAPMQTPQGIFMGLVFIIRDISEEVRTEEQRHHSQRMESVGKLASGIAYEFNNYLSAIMGFSEILKQDTPEEHANLKYIKKINNSTKKASDLAKKLLMLSRKTKAEFVSTNIHCLILEALSLLKCNINSSIRIDKKLDALNFHVPGDPSELQTVFLNLIMNSAEAIPKGGKITLKTSNASIPTPCDLKPILPFAAGNYLRIDIIDSGTGIPEEIHSQIFDPYFTTKEKAKGSGLGLTTVYSIIKAHHGGIILESSALLGTTFSIFLPILSSSPNNN